MRFVGESGTAVTGEVGREETEPLSDMKRETKGECSAQGDMQVGSTKPVIDTPRPLTIPSSLFPHDERDPNSTSAQGFLRSLPSPHTPSNPDKRATELLKIADALDPSAF